MTTTILKTLYVYYGWPATEQTLQKSKANECSLLVQQMGKNCCCTGLWPRVMWTHWGASSQNMWLYFTRLRVYTEVIYRMVTWVLFFYSNEQQTMQHKTYIQFLKTDWLLNCLKYIYISFITWDKLECAGKRAFFSFFWYNRNLISDNPHWPLPSLFFCKYKILIAWN